MINLIIDLESFSGNLEFINNGLVFLILFQKNNALLINKDRRPIWIVDQGN